MIENEHQAEITRKWADNFRKSADQLESMPGVQSATRDLMIKAYRSEYESLMEQIKEYESKNKAG